MEAHHRKGFVVDHTLIAALILAVVVSGVTLVVTLALTGDLPGIRQTSTAGVGTSGSVDLPQDQTTVRFTGFHQWSVDDAYGPSLREGSVRSGSAAHGQDTLPGADRSDTIVVLREVQQPVAGSSDASK